MTFANPGLPDAESGSASLPLASQPAASLSPAAVRRGRRTLLLLAFVCALPVLASYLMFYFWQPSGRVNHGELLQPAPLPAHALPGAGGQPALLASEMHDRWMLVVVADSACDAVCERALYVSRQARIAQAKEMERVGRLWLISDAGEVSAAQLAQRFAAHDDLRVAHADAAWLAAFPGAPAAGAIFLVDPLGNVMMRFDDQSDAVAEARELIKDLQRLLKYSALGRGA